MLLLFIALSFLSPCYDCLEFNCVYNQIELVYDRGKLGLDESVLVVCKLRGIKDSASIELIKMNYK